LETDFPFKTVRTSPPKEADALLVDISGFSKMSLGAMARKTGLVEKGTSTVSTTLRGFGAVLVGVQEIGEIVLETGGTMTFGWLPGIRRGNNKREGRKIGQQAMTIVTDDVGIQKMIHFLAW